MCLLFQAKRLVCSASALSLTGASLWLTCAMIPFAGSVAEARVLSTAWSFMIHAPCDSSPAIGDDGTIYFGVFNGDFRAFSPDGSPKWVFHAGLEIKSSPAIGSDGTLYFGCRDRKLYAISPDGKRKWDYKTGAWIDSSPAIDADGTIYFGSWDKNFYALKPDGSKKWLFQTGGEIVSSPAIGADGRIYFGSHDRNFYAISRDGQKVWAFATGGPIISSAAIDSDGTVYFTAVDGFFYSLSAQGALNWRLKTGGITEASPVIGQDRTIYVGVNKALWAISADGKKKWEQIYGSASIDAAPLALADNTVCFVSRQGILINLGAPNEFQWSYDENWCGTICPAIGLDGRIYTVGLGTGFFVCALETQVKLAQSAWPRFRADDHNTGRQNKNTP